VVSVVDVVKSTLSVVVCVVEVVRATSTLIVVDRSVEVEELPLSAVVVDCATSGVVEGCSVEVEELS